MSVVATAMAVVVSVPTWSSAFIAPRNLKLPVFCRHSAWIDASAHVQFKLDGGERGVRGTWIDASAHVIQYGVGQWGKGVRGTTEPHLSTHLEEDLPAHHGVQRA